MKETTKKIVIELLKNEIAAVRKSTFILDTAVITAEAEKNAPVMKTQKRLKERALQRLEELQDALDDLN